MRKNKTVYILAIGFLLFAFISTAQPVIIKVKGHRFFSENKPVYFVGTNYWYGGLLGLQNIEQNGVERLRSELDFLKSNGVSNLRILAGPEGTGLVSGVDRVNPPLQTGKSEFDSTFLRSFDLLLSEMGKRNMKAVVYLSNNWEWSGGFLQYLRWNNLVEDSIFRRRLNWDEMRDYISKFYSCEPCKVDYLNKVAYILNRTNSITHIKYTDDPAIMSWELANEPRPMRPAAIDSYKNWVSDVAAFIKAKDINHLVTIGTEGFIGTENMEVYQSIHEDKNIDYLTIHIWPKNWNWFNGVEIAGGMDSVLLKTVDYISRHKAIANKLNKPLVIEEFGLPRDGHSFDPGTSTSLRDKYYQFIFDELKNSKDKQAVIAGVNFWSFGGNVKPTHITWQQGDAYIGDPPMEEQGLNSVFITDKTTWEIIQAVAEKLKN